MHLFKMNVDEKYSYENSLLELKFGHRQFLTLSQHGYTYNREPYLDIDLGRIHVSSNSRSGFSLLPSTIHFIPWNCRRCKCAKITSGNPMTQNENVKCIFRYVLKRLYVRHGYCVIDSGASFRGTIPKRYAQCWINIYKRLWVWNESINSVNISQLFCNYCQLALQINTQRS